jgi:hypothetical protein
MKKSIFSEVLFAISCPVTIILLGDVSSTLMVQTACFFETLASAEQVYAASEL